MVHFHRPVCLSTDQPIRVSQQLTPAVQPSLSIPRYPSWRLLEWCYLRLLTSTDNKNRINNWLIQDFFKERPVYWNELDVRSNVVVLQYVHSTLVVCTYTAWPAQWLSHPPAYICLLLVLCVWLSSCLLQSSNSWTRVAFNPLFERHDNSL